MKKVVNGKNLKNPVKVLLIFGPLNRLSVSIFSSIDVEIISYRKTCEKIRVLGLLPGRCKETGSFPAGES